MTSQSAVSGLLVLRDLKAPRDLKDIKDRKDPKGLRDLPELLRTIIPT
jgi:hypothetical protein